LDLEEFVRREGRPTVQRPATTRGGPNVSIFARSYHGEKSQESMQKGTGKSCTGRVKEGMCAFQGGGERREA